MATKFKFEIESDGLTPSQTLAFRTFIGTLGGTDFQEELRQEELKAASDKITPDYAEGIKKGIAEAVENTKKKRASRAKVEEAMLEKAEEEMKSEEAVKQLAEQAKVSKKSKNKR